MEEKQLDELSSILIEIDRLKLFSDVNTCSTINNNKFMNITKVKYKVMEMLKIKKK